MNKLFLQKCANHIDREAVAKCMECGLFFCRECIIEHEDRLICSKCLHKKSIDISKKDKKNLNFSYLIRFMLGFILMWFIFSFLGSILTKVKHQFHSKQYKTEIMDNNE